jgi:hypothetical protein
MGSRGSFVEMAKDKSMKKNALTKNTFFLWGILFGLLGSCIALLTYKYTAEVRGILGFLAVYMTIQYARNIGVAVSMDKLLSHPKIYKTYIYIFLGAMITYWALQEIYEMIVFLVGGIILFRK